MMIAKSIKIGHVSVSFDLYCWQLKGLSEQHQLFLTKVPAVLATTCKVKWRYFVNRNSLSDERLLFY